MTVKLLCSRFKFKQHRQASTFLAVQALLTASLQSTHLSHKLSEQPKGQILEARRNVKHHEAILFAGGLGDFGHQYEVPTLDGTAARACWTFQFWGSHVGQR